MNSGDILFNRYEIMRKLGSGGMSDVYLCTSLETGSIWAVKHIRRGSAGERTIAAEAGILKRLNHTNLPKIVDILQDAGGTYIIESYIEGTTLEKKLLQCSNIPFSTKLDWALELCDILIYLHRLKPYPIIYRDLKPSNIMVTPDGRVVLVDFGISKAFGIDDRHDTYAAGTFFYAAPEQLEKGGHTDHRTDIYSLGMTLQQLFRDAAGGKPASACPRRGGWEDAKLESIIKKCTALDAKERYPSVKRLRQDLEQLRLDVAAGASRKQIRIGVCLGISLLLSLITYAAVIRGLFYR